MIMKKRTEMYCIILQKYRVRNLNYDSSWINTIKLIEMGPIHTINFLSELKVAFILRNLIEK